ncbi:RagB/SusD family nutrient uptake outer membrane protein [Limibacter armeniacum]|uniref:RagB/SusD family nutrient uptake outer membrane protein n=1 Tax=Limibacter armeniacum TaxID=466084 RepID=UPI002FE62F93
MNFKRYIVAMACAAVVLSGCDDYLEYTPNGNEVITEDAIVDEASVEMLLNGAYKELASGNFYGGRVQNIAELMGENIDGSSLTEGELGIYTFQSNIFDDYKNQVYAQPYTAIRRANLVLEYMSLVSEGKKTQFEAEARFIRAISLFEVSRLFGKPYVQSTADSDLSVPIRLDSDPKLAPVRATATEVYAQVIGDLEFAESNLPEVVSRFETDRYANKWSAKAYLARVYFQMNMFQEAFDYANDVISNSGKSLDMSDTYYMDRFTAEASVEELFGLVSMSAQNNNGGELSGKYRSDKNLPGFRISTNLYDLATAAETDKRAALYDDVTYPGFIVLTKFNEKDYVQVPLVHMTEMYLTRAEAAAELGGDKLVNAQQDLQVILDRAYGAAVKTAPTDQDELISQVRQERRLELVAEGDRIHQVKRIGAKGETSYVKGAPWNCPGMLLQFPKSEIDSNREGFVPNEEGGCN